MVDESTSRDGNCAISACVISLRSLLKGGQCKKGTATEVRNAAVLEAMPARAASDTGSRCSSRVVGQHAQTKLWEGMTVSGLTHVVTGEDFPSYVQRMQRNREWVDTAFTHALACAFGVAVLVFQDGVDPATIGPN